MMSEHEQAERAELRRLMVVYPAEVTTFVQSAISQPELADRLSINTAKRPEPCGASAVIVRVEGSPQTTHWCDRRVGPCPFGARGDIDGVCQANT